MKNIWSLIADNRQEAVDILRHNVGYNEELDILDEVLLEEIGDNNAFPYVLIADKYDMVFDCAVSKIKLCNGDKIELYIDEWNEWVEIDECLSATENNVYEFIDEYFKKQQENEENIIL